MAINLQSLSLTSAFSAIINFFRSQENNQKFKDMSTNGSEGAFLIRLLANIFSTLSYRIVAQSRENYLSTAALPSSNIGISVNLGYSTFRGSNLKRRITIVPNGNYTLPHLSQIGTFDSLHNIYVLGEIDKNTGLRKDVTLIEGQATSIQTVVGNVKEETIVAGTSDIKIFTLFTTGISEDYVLYLGSKEVPTTKVIKNMTEDKYLVRTNPYSSVDIMYLNTFSNAKYTYGVDSEITIRYIELENVGNAAYATNMFATYGTLTGVANISTYLPPETVEQMKVNAPLDHETQNLIRSKQDYANRMQQIVPANIDTNWTAVTPTYTQITYLKNDYTLLSDSEREDVLQLLKDENYFGTPLPDITPPRREVAHLKIQIALTNKYKNIADINLDIENILKSFYDARLGDTFNTFDLERKIESLSYVKYARVSHMLDERKANTQYQIGYMITGDNGLVYKASKILGLAGEEMPHWEVQPTPPQQIDPEWPNTQDGSLVWHTYKRLPNMPTLNFVERKPSNNGKYFGLGDFVYDDMNAPGYMFKCVDMIKSSGFKAPDLTYAELGDFVVDGNIVWVVKDYSESYDPWQSTTNYSLGDSANISSSGEFSLECVSYTGSTGSKPTVDFELLEYPVIEQGINTFTVAGRKIDYFWEGDIISATYSEGATSFVVQSAVYDGIKSETIITVTRNIQDDPNNTIQYQNLVTVQRGTKDGQILWTVVDDPTNITYQWSSFVTFDHTLEIIE